MELKLKKYYLDFCAFLYLSFSGFIFTSSLLFLFRSLAKKKNRFKSLEEIHFQFKVKRYTPLELFEKAFVCNKTKKLLDNCIVNAQGESENVMNRGLDNSYYNRNLVNIVNSIKKKEIDLTKFPEINTKYKDQIN